MFSRPNKFNRLRKYSIRVEVGDGMKRYTYNVGKDTRVYECGGDKHPVAFKIFYGDYSVYSSSGEKRNLLSDWMNAPKHNIQIVVLYENTKMSGRHTRMGYSGFDYYIFNGRRFIFSNDLHDGIVLFGKWAQDYETFMDIYHKALDTNIREVT